MNQRSILITGCSTGIGRCCAEGLAKRGYRVFATARKDRDLAELDAITNIEALPLDLNRPEQVEQTAETVLSRTDGKIHALFNNGGYGQPGAVEDLKRDVLRQQFETLVFGWHDLTVRILPAMRRNGEGRIIQNSSILGLTALPMRGAYNSAKFAIEGLTDTLRLELEGSGIHVSLIEPGPIQSRFRANASAAFRDNITIEGSPFQTRYQDLSARLDQAGLAAPGTLPPEAVFKKLLHALEAPKPKARYYVTWPTHLLGRLRRILPTSALDAVLLKVAANESRRR